MASPNRPEGASWAYIRRTLYFLSDRVNHRCLSAATSNGMDRQMARAVSLVARRTKSAVLLSSVISCELNCSPSSSYFNRSAWYAYNIDIVCRLTPAWWCGYRGKKGRLRHGGSGLVLRNRSSSSLFWGSACFSASQSMLNLTTARVTTSNNSSFWGDWGGESSTLSTSTSSEPAPRGEETASDLREQATNLAGEEEDSDSPVSIPSAKSSCEPHECSCYSILAEVGPAPWGTLLKAPPSKRASLPNSPCTN